MFIGICGAKCAGKNTVAQYLIDHQGFKRLQLLKEGGEEESPNATEVQNENAAVAESTTTAPPKYTFTTVNSLLDFVTRNWQARWVTTDIHSLPILDALSRRPFFLLIGIDAPVTLRWQRFQSRFLPPSSPPSSTPSSSSTTTTFESFVQTSDSQLYHPTTGSLPLLSRSHLLLLNTSPTLPDLYAVLSRLDLTDPTRLRPTWDAYFMSLASLASRRCNCMKRAVGCVLVDSNRRVISTGYNGTPRHLRNCGEGGCPRCNDGGLGSGVALSTCLCLHAEENALLEAGRERIREGSVLYCDTCPCLTCSIKIVQVGISEVVYNQGYSMDNDTAEVLKSAGVKLRQFSPPANGLIHLEKLELN